MTATAVTAARPAPRRHGRFRTHAHRPRRRHRRRRRPGDVYVIEPGHDAWGVGDAALVAFEFESPRQRRRSLDLPDGPPQHDIVAAGNTRTVAPKVRCRMEEPPGVRSPIDATTSLGSSPRSAQGDEQAFARLVDQYHASMVRVARAYVATKEAAEDVVQDAWLGVIKGLDRFEGRSSLKTWMFRIVINRAMTKGGRDARSVPVLVARARRAGRRPRPLLRVGPMVRVVAVGRRRHQLPDRIVLGKESRAMIDAVIATLPANQRLVITLRDVQGFSAEEACELLGVSEANQRVLLHRARTRVRAALEDYVGEHVGAER